MERAASASRRPLVVAGVLLGVGLGGFVDGILLHQMLQWHNMLSVPVPTVDLVSMKVNMFWDGVFHAFSWVMTLLGAVLLFRAGRRALAGEAVWSGRVFAGALVLGWGLFNVTEGLIDHQLLGLHHVRMEGNILAWDVGFLAVSAALMLLGWGLIRAPAGARERTPPRPAIGARIEI